MTELKNNVTKIIDEKESRIYYTHDEDLATLLMALDLCKTRQVTCISQGVFGWGFQARTQADALAFEQRLQVKGVILSESDLRSKRQ